MNEPAHLVAGISHWENRKYDLYRVNPPLIRMVAAISKYLTNIQTDWNGYTDTSRGQRPIFQMGGDFLNANGENSYWIFTIARWCCIPFSLIGASVCYLWSKELFGTKAGLLSLTLWCFSPNVLAHAQLITPDCGATSMGVTSSYLFWIWLRTPKWSTAIYAGIALGTALAAKTTWILFFGLFPLIWFLYLLAPSSSSNDKDQLKKQGKQLIVILGLGFYFLNLVYRFEGTLIQLGEYQFISTTLTDQDATVIRTTNRFADSILSKIPVPLPQDYVLGIDIQKKDFENFGRESYLRGEFRDYGWWYYYLYALMIKMPIGTLALIAIGTFLFITVDRGKQSWLILLTVLFPAFFILILVSSQTGFNHHMRYVLPCLPFFFIIAGRAARVMDYQSKWMLFLGLTLLVWSVSSSLYYFPHSLSYFNEFAGGPMNGHNHLIHSNIDWGQDLKFLKKWKESHPNCEPFYLCYYPHREIKALGMDYPSPPVNVDADYTPPPGWYAISINYLKGYGWLKPKDGYSYFQKYTPVERAGYSIYIYHIREQLN
ncbi:glycosyltransferase family 39 protein [Gimesia maris]|uniref:glycosyltransferase family 39 protein n=1 Tax=Gimesia maris TaxID=122 RepID=UPI0030DACA9A